MSLFRDGVNWLRDALKASAAHDVIYRRGDATVTIRATVGKSVLKLQDDYGNVRVVYTDKDFIVAAEDLILDGQRILPERGDKITETIGDKTITWAVAAPGNEPEWRWCDPYQVMIRIHTVRSEEV